MSAAPFPHAADNHQEFNARLLVEKGAADMLLESQLNGEILGEKIGHYRRNPGERKRMAARAQALGRPEAVATIVSDMVARVIRF